MLHRMVPFLSIDTSRHLLWIHYFNASHSIGYLYVFIFLKMRVVGFLLLVFSCNFASSQDISFSKEDRDWAKKQLSHLNQREKIGQLFMMDVTPKLENANDKKLLKEKIKKLKVGGIIVMKGDYSIAADWIRDFQKTTKTPLLVSIDGEWGINMRIANTTKFPYQLTLGAIKDDQQIYNMGAAIAYDCQRLGIHVNFAPVIDVNTNPKNPVINFRSFGENKENVTAKGLAYALGMQDYGVMACLKHFPGHGDTDKDSHKDLPTIHKPREEIYDLELFPFRELIKKNVWSVMVGHLKVPSLEPTGIPTSLSKPVISGILNHEFGFRGLVFSDALNMKGVSENSTPGQLELDAYLAGNDILLYSENIEIGIDRIQEFVKANKLAEDELDDRVLKILLFKHKLNAHLPPPDNTAPEERLNSKLADDLYERALTLLSDDQLTLGNWMDQTKKTLFISPSDNNTELRKTLEKTTNFSFFNLPRNASEDQFDQAIRAIMGYDQVIISYHDLSQYENKDYGLSKSVIDFIENTSAKNQVLHLWFGNPYALKYFQKATNVLLAYEENSRTLAAVGRAFLEKKKLDGRLPVSVGRFAEGSGFQKVEEVKYNTPIGEMIDDDSLVANDRASIMNRIQRLGDEIIYSGVAPGFQMVVYHKGKEIYNQCRGKHTYGLESKMVNSKDLYDLASLTKILSTTLATMKLYEEGKLNLEKTVSEYIQLDDSATVKDVTIHQLLTHEAGLYPFIPFFQRFNIDNYFSYFDNKRSSTFPYQVAESMYVRADYKDSMWHEITHKTRSNIGSYKYSDLSMYILQRVIESISGMSLDHYVTKHFYKKIGVDLLYNPTTKYPIHKIAPTEFDDKFRLQQVQGYVHDQGACLYGGVSGHAGLFGSASDVAKIMQMLLNGGTLGKTKLLMTSTISKFTEQQRIGSRRGLGFDKPDMESPTSGAISRECSYATYGHTGFTGTCAWADPFQELVFVFLSNRVYPSAENKKLAKGKYRERLQSLFYKYIQSSK